MNKPIQYPTPIKKEKQKEETPKQEAEKQETQKETEKTNICTEIRGVRVKKNRRKGYAAVSDQWRRHFCEHPQQVARMKMQQEVKEGITFAKESVTYRMPMPVLRVRKRMNGDTYPLCPRCDASIDREYMRYCDRCGQSLDWSMIDYARTCYGGQK